MPNHLKNETSPYHLQHAETPADWYPGGEEAFRQAREEDKPVLLSIGYSACHWYLAGYAMFLLALLDNCDPPPKVTVVRSGKPEAERLPPGTSGGNGCDSAEAGRRLPAEKRKNDFQCLPGAQLPASGQ